MDVQAKNDVQALCGCLDRATTIVRALGTDTLTRREQETLTELEEATQEAERLAGELANGGTTSGVEACNTDCVAYSRGTCRFIDRKDCPRYRKYYPY